LTNMCDFFEGIVRLQSSFRS